MSQYPSVFRTALAEGNLNNSQQIPQPNYVQSKQGTNICPETRNGQSDYGLTSSICNNNQHQQPHQQQHPPQQQFLMMDSYLTTNSHPSLFYNNCCVDQSGKQAPQPPLMSTIQGYGFLPHNTSDQIRLCTSLPIFILPNGTPNNNSLLTCPVPFLSPTCFPYPMPLHIFHPVESKIKENECKCLLNKTRNDLTETYNKREKDIDTMSRIENNFESSADCCYKQNIKDICSKQNCPGSVQLQAIISQLLGIQGIISSAITRLLLKKIPSSNITDSMEEVIQWATKTIRQLTKDQLLKESKSCQEVNCLLRLYLTSSSTVARIIPILTSIQLKSNVLKALVEHLINARITEDQGCGAEDLEPVNMLILDLKTDDELRQLLSVLREKECQQRVNLSFAAYNSQRLIAESRLIAIQKKIGQIEKEMDRRHSNSIVIL